jgi:transcriptional regulator with XRE-family HTH domain
VPAYGIERLRAGRKQSGMTVRALARSVKVSPSFISQIENGKANPSVGTLLAIASVLEISLDELFAGAPDGDGAQPDARDAAPEPPSGTGTGLVLRAAHRRSVELAGGVRWERLTPGSDPRVTFLHCRYEVGGASCPPDALMRHSGREYGLVLSGRLGAQIGAETYRLDPGDSITMDADIPHRFWTIGGEPAYVVWTIIQPDD